MIPETQKVHNDLVDIVIESAQTVEEVEGEDGKKVKQLVLNPEIIWWKTLIVNNPTFGRLALEVKEWERLAQDCFDNMFGDRAFSIANDILAVGQSFRRSIDAKSSESLKDKNNSAATLIDKINRNKVERMYSLKSEGKKSVLEGIFGRDREREEYGD